MADARIDDLLARRGGTFCDEIGIAIARGTPSPLFRWLATAMMFAHPIRHGEVVRAAKALGKAGWRTPRAMAAATWRARVDVLNANGYARYDESTATRLEGLARHLLDTYRGDLRRLREAAGRDPAAIRERLRAIDGIGDTACDIFFREAQAAWDELHPFADDLALSAARRLGLPHDPAALARLVPRPQFPALVAALTRDALAAR